MVNMRKRNFGSFMFCPSSFSFGSVVPGQIISKFDGVFGAQEKTGKFRYCQWVVEKQYHF